MPQSNRSGGNRAALTSSQCSAVPSGWPKPGSASRRSPVASARRPSVVTAECAEMPRNRSGYFAQPKRAEPAHRQSGNRERRRISDPVVEQRRRRRDLFRDPAFVVRIGMRDITAAEAPQPVGGHRQRDGRNLPVSTAATRSGGRPFIAQDQALPPEPWSRISKGSVVADVPIGGAQKQMSARRPSAPLPTVIIRRPSRSKRGSERSTEAKEIRFTGDSLAAVGRQLAFVHLLGRYWPQSSTCARVPGGTLPWTSSTP